MHPSNKTISCIWVSDELSAMGRLSVCSFAANGHNVDLYTYGEIVNAPQPAGGGKISVRDANEILPRDNVFIAKGTYAEFADWFRWELMRQKGGWYADLDMVCLRPWDFSEGVVICEQSREYLEPAILKFPAGHKMAAAMADACANPNKIQPWDDANRIRRKKKRIWKFWKNTREKTIWGEAGGPEGATLAAQYFNLQNAVMPSHFFTPVHCHSWDNSIKSGAFYDELGDIVMRHSYGIHLCGNMWRRFGEDENGTFPPDSLYEKLKRKYLPDYAKAASQ